MQKMEGERKTEERDADEESRDEGEGTGKE